MNTIKKTNHTKGPWEVEDREIFYSGNEFSRGARMIAECGMSTNPEIDQANAKRIVECVNACEGIENPIAIRELIDAVKAERDPLRAWQGTELAEARRRIDKALAALGVKS